jgi:hypothetical protein
MHRLCLQSKTWIFLLRSCGAGFLSLEIWSQGVCAVCGQHRQISGISMTWSLSFKGGVVCYIKPSLIKDKVLGFIVQPGRNVKSVFKLIRETAEETGSKANSDYI